MTEFISWESNGEPTINKKKIAKDRKRIGDTGGPVKNRSKAKGIGKKRGKHE